MLFLKERMRKKGLRRKLRKNVKNRDMLSWGQPQGDYCFFPLFLKKELIKKNVGLNKAIFVVRL